MTGRCRTCSPRAKISLRFTQLLRSRGLAAHSTQLWTSCARRSPIYPAELENLVFTISRELLANSAKHSGATRVVLRVARVDDAVQLIASDNGHGFAERSLGAALDRGHIGLASISERVEALGGRFEIDSQHGHGTRVSVILPAVTAPGIVPGGVEPGTRAAAMVPPAGATQSPISAARSR